jgi:hypothetical protein
MEYYVAYAGCLLPVGKHVQFNPYYEHDNETGKKSTAPVIQLVLRWIFLFPWKRDESLCSG